MKIHEEDLKFTPVDADPDFDPEHNRKVIEKTIKQYEATRRQKMREFEDKLGERTDAATQYLKSLSEGRNSTSAERYFGKKYLSHLRGQEIINKIKRVQ